jgi:hypothetical protein
MKGMKKLPEKLKFKNLINDSVIEFEFQNDYWFYGYVIESGSGPHSALRPVGYKISYSKDNVLKSGNFKQLSN